ncbi:hypothetical protein ABZ619_17060 [Streptomyces sp. NPDC007851]|uniref:hypothetical protein n=1 Tax=Streptomyces sp. NPDC007851 TaxID=3155008 RepID=UPI0033E5B155
MRKRHYDAELARELAKALVRADYALRGERLRLGMVPPPDEGMWSVLRRWVREAFSAGRRGEGTALADGARGDHGGAAQDPGQTPFDRVRALSEVISGLPRAQREAVENAVLELLRKSPYREAYEESPASMPYAARLANDAYERQRMGPPNSTSDVSRALLGAQDRRFDEHRAHVSGRPAPTQDDLSPGIDGVAASSSAGDVTDEAATGRTSGWPGRAVETFTAADSAWSEAPTVPPDPASSLPSVQRVSLVGPEGIKAAYGPAPTSRTTTPGGDVFRSNPNRPASPATQSSARNRVR